MAVEFSEHANQKLKILRRHKVKVTRKLVEDTVSKPDRVVQGQEGGRSLKGVSVKTMSSGLCLSVRRRTCE